MLRIWHTAHSKLNNTGRSPSPLAYEEIACPRVNYIISASRQTRQLLRCTLHCTQSSKLQYYKKMIAGTCANQTKPNQRRLHRSDLLIKIYFLGQICFFYWFAAVLQSNPNLSTATFSPGYAVRISQPIQREFRRSPICMGRTGNAMQAAKHQTGATTHYIYAAPSLFLLIDQPLVYNLLVASLLAAYQQACSVNYL